MDQEKLHEFSQVLEAELRTLVDTLNEIATLDDSTGDWVAVPETEEQSEADANSEADHTEAWNERRATLAQLETRYRNIVRALDKIQTNTFGKCEISGQPIELERLEANPAARTNLANIEREKELPL
jgi:RNA polymerase-binding transcription factor DksA